jgi:hypothetical protein
MQMLMRQTAWDWSSCERKFGMNVKVFAHFPLQSLPITIPMYTQIHAWKWRIEVMNQDGNNNGGLRAFR